MMKKDNLLRKSINESVKQFIMEFGSGNSEKAKENRKKMAMASKRAVDNGRDDVYLNSVRSITTGGGSKEDLEDFNDEFEKLNSQPANNLATEGRNQIKVSESQLFNIIEESVRRILAEAEIDPRSWDAVARRYDQTDPQKAAYARQRGVQSWNRQYGGDARMNNDGSLEDTGEIHPVPYRDSEVNAPFSISRFQSNVVSNEPKYSGWGRTKYTPNTNGTFDLEHNDYTKLSKNGMEREFDGTRAANENPTKVNYQKGVPLGNYSKRFNVASQMKTGNGVYDKSKGGWQ